jgi:signal transduction histidine kinase
MRTTEGLMGLGECRILLVEDDDGDAGLIYRSLRQQSEFTYSVDRAYTLDECISLCNDREFDIILLDLHLPGSDNLDTVRAVIHDAPGPAVIVVTGLDDASIAVQAVKAGAHDYLVKHNVNAYELCRSIRYAQGRKQAGNDLVRVRNEFLSNVTHEFRTPLTAIVGAIEMLHDGDCGTLSPMADRVVSMAGRSLLLLQAMVGNLIDTTMVRTGDLSVNARPVAAPALVASVVDAMIPTARNADVTLICRVDGPLVIQGDPERIIQVLTNLITNAINHTPAGGTVSVTAEVAHGGAIEFAVEDTGTGIAPEAVPHLFEPLYQAPKSEVTASRRGLGLGLYLSREIIRAHNGELSVASPHGGGSRFAFSLQPG